jgi:hypothetical protein
MYSGPWWIVKIHTRCPIPLPVPPPPNLCTSKSFAPCYPPHHLCPHPCAPLPPVGPPPPETVAPPSLEQPLLPTAAPGPSWLLAAPSVPWAASHPRRPPPTALTEWRCFFLFYFEFDWIWMKFDYVMLNLTKIWLMDGWLKFEIQFECNLTLMEGWLNFEFCYIEFD